MWLYTQHNITTPRYAAMLQLPVQCLWPGSLSAVCINSNLWPSFLLTMSVSRGCAWLSRGSGPWSWWRLGQELCLHHTILTDYVGTLPVIVNTSLSSVSPIFHHSFIFPSLCLPPELFTVHIVSNIQHLDIYKTKRWLHKCFPVCNLAPDKAHYYEQRRLQSCSTAGGANKLTLGPALMNNFTTDTGLHYNNVTKLTAFEI